MWSVWVVNVCYFSLVLLDFIFFYIRYSAAVVESDKHSNLMSFSICVSLVFPVIVGLIVVFELFLKVYFASSFFQIA